MSVLLRLSLIAIAVVMLGGCETSGYGYSGSSVGASYYHSPGWYDPYYNNRCCYTVVRPPAYRPGRPVQLPARPRPTQLPAPRPMPRSR